MKEKKVWIVIGCILVLGSTVTGYTHSYIKKQPDFYETEAVLMAGGASRMAGPEGRSAGSQAPSGEAAPAPASLEADAGVPAAASFGAPAAGEAQMPEMAGRAASPEADSGPASPEAVSISPAAGPGQQTSRIIKSVCRSWTPRSRKCGKREVPMYTPLRSLQRQSFPCGKMR